MMPMFCREKEKSGKRYSLPSSTISCIQSVRICARIYEFAGMGVKSTSMLKMELYFSR